MNTDRTSINIIFVCTGNICRSPSAEGIFKSIVAENGLEDRFNIDSAGTDSYHNGEAADSRMRKHAGKRGYSLTSRSRKLNHDDLEKFDYIIAMDYGNYQQISRYDRKGLADGKLCMMNDFSAVFEGLDVPDPWYGGPDGFETVLDMLEDGCRGLLEYLKKEYEL
ncbi:MAG: low molecular weight phosphotyrosine protein phosphatase [Spirochaetales bacterium]|uniref:Low molecular weight phosphotyrosine protein phosphatase n=1 Tax=Candidatus Thalassospirochaeta sargassi TaxID=3119039 RepID=A0AAJ1IAH5_9SPIO|nr:low molecular weight phosphotyrosine protein phosphatase [Spirochaetales bacterium]